VTLKSSFRYLRPPDILALVFDLAMSLLFVARIGTIGDAGLVLSLNLAVGGGIFLLAFLSARSGNGMWRIIHDWYLVPLVFLSFKEIHVFIQAIQPEDKDYLLIAIDRWIFHMDPTVWLWQFSSPPLTEILQISYSSFYFLMLTMGFELYVRREYPQFSFAVFSILYGFFLSYVGYLLVPGVGPRFTLHNFQLMDTELPGVFLTTTLRDLINAGESIPKGALNAMKLAQRDVFPSGHTEMTLITMYLAQRYRLSSRHVINILGVLLIVGTVYLRYHYVIDLIAGTLVMSFVVWSGRHMFLWLERVRGNPLPII